MNDDLIRDLEMYAAVAEEGGKIYCASLMNRAARALRKEKDRAAGGSAAWSAKKKQGTI